MMTMCDDEKKLKIIARAVKTSVRKKKNVTAFVLMAKKIRHTLNWKMRRCAARAVKTRVRKKAQPLSSS